MAKWVVEFHGEFELEFNALSRDVQDGLLAAAKALQSFGPFAGRPHVDSLAGSRYANMKELRFKGHDGNEQWRVAFAVDPARRVIGRGMGRNLDDILDSLPKARRDSIEGRAAKILKEMAAASLQELRRAADKTQVQIAESMGLAQNAISQLERRQDVRLSTLDRYVEAVGGSVMVVVQLRNGERFRLKRVASPVTRKPAPSQRSSKLKSRT